MDHGKKKFSGSLEASKKGPALGLVIALAAAGGVIIGSAVTYSITKPKAVPKQPPSPLLSEMPPVQPVTTPPQYTSAPQPPGETPPGKVWSVEHGHWHDAPRALTIPAPAPPDTSPASSPVTVIPAATPPPAPAAAPVEKKE